MGSLKTAGVISGIGKGMISNVEASRRSEEKDLDRMHAEMLQNMRDTAASERVTQTHDLGIEDYNRQREHTLADLEKEHEYQAGLLESEREHGKTTLEDEQAHALELQELKNVGSIKAAQIRVNPKQWEKFKLKVSGGVDAMGFETEVEIPIAFNNVTGLFYQEKGGELLSFDMVANLPEDEGILATDPTYAMAYAIAKGGADKLPEWFKQVHPEITEAVRKDYKREGGGKEEPGPPAKDVEVAPIEVGVAPTAQPGDGSVLRQLIQGTGAPAQPKLSERGMLTDAEQMLQGQ